MITTWLNVHVHHGIRTFFPLSCRHEEIIVLPIVPLLWDEACHSLLRRTDVFTHRSILLVFSLHFSSSSAFLGSLFRQDFKKERKKSVNVILNRDLFSFAVCHAISEEEGARDNMKMEDTHSAEPQSGIMYSWTKVKVWFYIALYPVRWTAQSALHFPPLADLFIPTPFSASLGSILAMQQLRNDYSLTFPPLSIARYSFIQLSRLRRREVKENAQTSKR